jgi:hypothetical protein
MARYQHRAFAGHCDRLEQAPKPKFARRDENFVRA